ncbi:DUF4376 domain-containing protein [Salmonella enterica]|uniref:DUF4376 domain-containing protein n=1 Tax=Salmonella enterica TaxID=28901 RepID=A0A5Y9P6M4_SALER|nr:DUF4376 domain-containing protein [Salmonella enterica]EBG8798882.1 DUF4376 domain-containing protein [Salmonella enterica]EBK9094125.1 DUF4376 domain-containing protein [Salmonella enterica]EBM1998690.1 DUF4376 domain-containing protein [Salmonella enterica]EBO6518300.1 DUF4376 domain-containing protein [Salmonella enterica]
MINIKNFTPGIPKTPEQLELANKHRVLFLFSEDGQEWYESQKQFAADTIKFTYDADGVIRSISRDVSALWPVNMSVAEVADTTANRRADISGRWGFDGTDVIDLMTPEKARRMKRDEINRWRDRQENGNVSFDWSGRKWDAGKDTLARITPVLIVASAGKLPAGFFWTDADDNNVPLNADELIQLNQEIAFAMVMQGFKIHERQQKMKQDLEALTRVNDILAYSVGWDD